MFVFWIVEVKYVFHDFFEDRQRACSQSLRETLTLDACQMWTFFLLLLIMVSVHHPFPTSPFREGFAIHALWLDIPHERKQAILKAMW